MILAHKGLWQMALQQLLSMESDTSLLNFWTMYRFSKNSAEEKWFKKKLLWWTPGKYHLSSLYSTYMECKYIQHFKQVCKQCLRKMHSSNLKWILALLASEFTSSTFCTLTHSIYTLVFHASIWELLWLPGDSRMTIGKATLYE